MNGFLPVSRQDMQARGWEECDFVYVVADAYVDHPTFGHAIISRVLEHAGYRVGIIPQPDWKDPASVMVLGAPRLAFLVAGGNMDSLVNHYTVAKRRRSMDYYSPGGKMGLRPDRATIVYSNLIRQACPGKPVIIGGIEASLRRLAHYDYWSDSLRRSILLDSQADLLLYGMGERSIVEMADALNSGLRVQDLTFLDGTVYKTRSLEDLVDYVMLPDWKALKQDKKYYARSFYTQYCNTDPYQAKRLVEPYEGREFVVQNPPCKPLTTQEMDEVYALPYMRTWHPMYRQAGGVPAIDEVKFSLTSCRGCFGGCSFCALTFHQGRIVQTRSHESILAEAELLIRDPDFKGYIHDVGGPTANFRQPACRKQLTAGACVNRQCLFPSPCKNLTVDHSDYLALLRKLRALPGVKKVFIRSGIRFDYLIYDKDDTFFRELVEHHISGQLKVAPEHICDSVLQLMGKPANSVYLRFLRKYQRLNQQQGKKQFVVPYLISSHPGSTLTEAIALAEAVRDMGYMPEQVQDFYPTPSTISTVMYYTGYDPRTMQRVYVATDPHEKAMQRALIQYRNPKNYDLVHEALTKAGRTDLIGYDKQCLIRPRKGEAAAANKSGQSSRAKNGGIGRTKDSGDRAKNGSGKQASSGSRAKGGSSAGLGTKAKQPSTAPKATGFQSQQTIGSRKTGAAAKGKKRG